MAKIHGQLDERRSRIHQTTRWLNATPLDAICQPIEVCPSSGEVQLDVVHSSVDIIRTAINDGIGVRVTEMHAPNVEAIKDLLSAQELIQISFDFDEMKGGQPG